MTLSRGDLRAKITLNELEKKDIEKGPGTKLIGEDLPLFSKNLTDKTSSQSNRNSELSEKIESIYPDQISPNEALQLLYKLKEISNKN